MNRTDIEKRIKGLNDVMLADSNKKLIICSISSDYTYNKAIALVDKDTKETNWYSIDYKNCFKTWNEADSFLDGLCLAKNTKFYDDVER